MRKTTIKIITAILILSLPLLFFLLSPKEVDANVGSVHGNVYMEFNGNKIPLPGVRIRRTDGNTMRSLVFYVKNGVLDRTEEVYRTCSGHIDYHQRHSYGYAMFKYNCVRDIPQTYTDPDNSPNLMSYGPSTCRDICKYNECLYKAVHKCTKEIIDGVEVSKCDYPHYDPANPSHDDEEVMWTCDHEGDKVSASCSYKCTEFRSYCSNFIEPSDKLPTQIVPDSPDWDEHTANVVKYACRGGAQQGQSTANANGVEVKSYETKYHHSGNTNLNASNWHMTDSFKTLKTYGALSPYINLPRPLGYPNNVNDNGVWDSAVCPDGPAGNVTLKPFEDLNYCGFNCLENPHRMRAYFTAETYNFLRDNYNSIYQRIPADIRGSKSDPRGGGAWALRTEGQYEYRYHEGDPTIQDSDVKYDAHALPINYSDSWGQVPWEGYQPHEYYQAYIGNFQHWYGFNFKWVPPEEQHRPKITKIPESHTPWIGEKNADTDSKIIDSICTNNNPNLFKFEASDEDGADDIDVIEFNLANHLGATSYKNWPLRLEFARKHYSGGTAYADNMFLVRDKEVTNTTNPRCYSSVSVTSNGVSGTLGSTPSASNMYCFKAGPHSYESAQRTVVDGQEVFWLKDDITIYGDGFSITLLGGTSTTWSENTYVSFDVSGNNAKGQFNVQFEGDQSDNWEGQFDQLWRVADLTEREDQTPNIGSETVEVLGGHYFHKLAKTRLDFTPPTITLEKPASIAGNHILMNWTASDSGGSGLYRLIGEAVHDSGIGVGTLDSISARNRGDEDISSTYNPWNSLPPVDLGNYEDITSMTLRTPHLWNIEISTPETSSHPVVTEEIDLDGIKEGTLTIEGIALDHACNLGDSPASTQHVSYLPWMMTRAGIVYSENDFGIKVRNLSGAQNLCPDTVQGCSEFAASNAPFNVIRNEVSLSTELLGSGAGINSESLVGQTRTKTFTTKNYLDNNNLAWYESLWTIASKNVEKDGSKFSFSEFNPTSSDVDIPSVECTDPDKPCLIHAQQDVELSSYTCDRQAMIFVEKDLTLNGEIINSGNTDGCIFIVRGNVNIGALNTGDYGDIEPAYDHIDAFILADGQVFIEKSDDLYGLLYNGSLLGFGGVDENPKISIDIQRALKNDLSQSSPSMFLHYDPRFLYIANDFIYVDNFSHEQEIGEN